MTIEYYLFTDADGNDWTTECPPSNDPDFDLIRIADYTAPTKRYDGAITISVIEDGRRHFIAEHKVDGKRAARAIAAQYNAKPWNF